MPPVHVVPAEDGIIVQWRGLKFWFDSNDPEVIRLFGARRPPATQSAAA
jgi:hypothetical protein